MKKFIIDQSIFLMVGIVIMVFIPVIWGPLVALFLEPIAIVFWCYLCRRILLLPIDLFIGKVKQTACFGAQSGVEDLEFFKNTYYCEWKFNLKNRKTLRLLVPIAITPKETYKLVPPQKDVIYKITYLRLSKVLLQWEQVE